MRIVLLEHPRASSARHFNDIANTPLWSCLMTGYAAASLTQAGFEVEIIDATRRSFDETVTLLSGTRCDLLAVHAVYFWERTSELFEMLAALRTAGYRGSIGLFGFFPTLAWKDILDHVPAVDFVVVGEPEETLVELATSLNSGANTRIDGLAAKIDGKATLSGLRTPINAPDKLPFPVRPSLETEATVSILASRGCYNGCSFCLIPTLNGGRALWRGRSTANVTAEVTELVQRGKHDLYFVDPNFIGPGKAGKDNAMDLARALAELGITFGMETRANDVTGPLLRDLAKAGLTSLLLGIESGSPRVLKRLHKNATVTHNERAIAAVRDAGIEPEIGFIMFEPASSLDDVVENTRFLERNRLLDRLGRTANLLYHEHIAFKGTPGYRLALQHGMLVPEGLHGFEGRLLYQDPRVGWLAGMMRPICQSILQEMGKPTSPIHWSTESAETVGNQAFQALNDHLVDLFKHLLATAAGFTSEPDVVWTERLLGEMLGELQTRTNPDTDGHGLDSYTDEHG
jgi:anaerobic magnesium-protoporphyrin IX monomethyl ester cyclase